MNIPWKIVTILLLAFFLTSCESEALLEPNQEDSSPIRILVLTPARIVGDTVAITSVMTASIQEDLLYYWLLGDDSSFSARKDTVTHVYHDPGFKTITLTVRRKKDFAIVSRDSALVEVLDTSWYADSLLHPFTKVEARVRAVFKLELKSDQQKQDTTLTIDTLLQFSLILTYEKGIKWNGAAFSISDGYTEQDYEGGRALITRSVFCDAYGSTVRLNGLQMVSTYLKAGKGTWSQGSGFSATDDFTNTFQAHALPLVKIDLTNAVFRACGSHSVQYLRICTQSNFNTVSYIGKTYDGGSKFYCAPQSLQNNSAFVEIRFFR